MLPRLYRVGVAAAGSDATLDHDKEGLPLPGDTDASAPQFRAVPTRWLVLRRSRQSVPAFDAVGIPEYQAWVIESDKQTKVQDMGSSGDLQVDMSPFITVPEDTTVNIAKQAETFIGCKVPLDEWHEENKPRPLLTIMHGGNMLFSDFQQHNTNVFSMLDGFQYTQDGKTQRLDTATADYYVIGWHAVADQDPFHIAENSKVTGRDRLESSQLVLDPNSPNGQEWSESSEAGHTISHGAMYGVEWNVIERPKNIPADKLGEHLHDLAPIAVGSTPLDVLLAYVKASQKNEHDEAVKQVMEAIESIQKYLLMQEDTVDGHDQAEDLLYSFNFDNYPGGIRWHVARATDPTKPASKPSKQVVDKLAKLNREQMRFDSIVRTQERLRWDVFAIWWGFVTRGIGALNTEHDANEDVKAWKARRRELSKALVKCTSNLKEMKEDDQEMAELIARNIISASVHPNFHTQSDPTLLVGHVESAWPHDWLDRLLVRVNTDIASGDDGENLDHVHDLLDLKSLPDAIRDTAWALINEFVYLSSDQVGAGEEPADQSHKAVRPLYHDLDPRNETQRDRWNDTQPFVPLFLEWETEYAHIDYSQWSFGERAFTGQNSAKLSYGISDSDTPLYAREEWDPDQTAKEYQDLRLLSGRVLILPQAAFSLQAQVNSVITQAPRDELKKALGDMTIEELQHDLSKLAVLSPPLSGFHDHLSTLSQGTHIKPTIRRPGDKLKVMKEAINETAGFDQDVISYMDTETDLTPYATLVGFSNKIKQGPFKPATHGQFKFTKLNFVDKFGQVVHALEPRWEKPPESFRPCLSDFYSPKGCLTDKYLLTNKTDIKNDRNVIADAAGLPKMGMADWAWLQPYDVPKQRDGGDVSSETAFMPLGLAGADTSPTFEDGPYTSLEGYLWLRQSIIRDNRDQ